MRSVADSWRDKQFVQEMLAQITWHHDITILEKIKSLKEREFYIKQSIEHGCGRSILVMQIESNLFARQGITQTNFEQTLPKPQSDLANQLLKDPYNFDFLTIGLEAHEGELES